MTYPRICRTCGQRTTVTAPVADYDQLPRTCPPPCGGQVGNDQRQGRPSSRMIRLCAGRFATEPDQIR